MNPEHLAELIRLWSNSNDHQRRELFEQWRPKMTILTWAAHVFGDDLPEWAEALPDLRPNRFELSAMLPGLETPAQIVTVFAWGGMGVRNGRSFKNFIEEYVDAVRKFASSRVDCFRTLHGIEARGVGPAFYTKLIRFLRDDAPDTGFIMDQWLARSINLLDRNFIRMHGCGKKYVHRKNDAETYSTFCDAVERIGREVGAPAAQLEEFMFASPEWRDHVKQNKPC